LVPEDYRRRTIKQLPESWIKYLSFEKGLIVELRLTAVQKYKQKPTSFTDPANPGEIQARTKQIETK
jgi:phosphate uptake regulator